MHSIERRQNHAAPPPLVPSKANPQLTDHPPSDVADLDPIDPHTDDEAVTDPRQRTFILITMCVALAAVIASVSGLNVAQQALAADIGASQRQLLWIINGYALALAALLLPVGAIGDRWGRKPVLVLGLIGFIATRTGRSTQPVYRRSRLGH